jgi:hypothetical protein
LTRVETQAEHGGRRTSVGTSTVRKLPVSRKATNPRLTRVESVVLFVLLVALSMVVFVGVSGATRGGTTAACTANANAVSSAIAALRAENQGTLPNTSAGWERALLLPGGFIGAPFLSSWPRTAGYRFSVAGAGAGADTGDRLVPHSGDVLVVVTPRGLVYDATVHVGAACAAA